MSRSAHVDRGAITSGEGASAATEYTAYRGLAGRCAVVTGAAGGIGSAICRHLASAGVHVVAVDTNETALTTLMASLQTAGLSVVADITNEEDTDRYVAAAVNHFGAIDIFHANAGITAPVHNVADLDFAALQRVFSVNVFGTFLGASRVAKHMTQRGHGSILFTASVAALQGSAGVSIYDASKHAVLGLSRCLSAELAHTGVRVNTLCPGLVATDMMAGIEEGFARYTGAPRMSLASLAPLGRYARAEEVAALAAWIVSDEATYCHGEVFTISGGVAR